MAATPTTSTSSPPPSATGTITPRVEQRDPIARLIGQLQRSRAQELATTTGAVVHANSTRLALQRRMLFERLLDHRRHERRHQNLTDRREQLANDLAEARERARVAGEALEDAQRGTGRLTRRDGIAEARRNLTHARDAIAQAEKQLDHIEAQLRQTKDEERVGDVGADVAAYEAVNRALDEHVQRRVQAAAFVPTTYILRAIGERPDQPAEREAWRRTVTAIERYRIEWSIDDPDRAFGEPPREVAQRIAYRQALQHVKEGREWLLDRGVHEQGRAMTREVGLSR